MAEAGDIFSHCYTSGVGGSLKPYQLPSGNALIGEVSLGHFCGSCHEQEVEDGVIDTRFIPCQGWLTETQDSKSGLIWLDATGPKVPGTQAY